MGSTTTPRRGVPAWPVRFATALDSPASTLRGALWTPLSTRWYIGATASLFWVYSTVPSVLAAPEWIERAVGVLLIAMFCLAFLVAPPLAWMLSGSGRLLVCAAMLALSLLLLPWLGRDVAGLWTYVGVVIGMCVFSRA
ncbi:hypothetical protein C5C31_09305 [Rathayibacter rathayi]|uniref:hypothetical protein n=1 Tax=Rathayibacter rathayi TaxID=33887 RepID=UPI000CE908FD|nr:hypothetical protein [Rathayibacter rathayi]PPG67587.1 hypothetical protein C5C02_09545 [Rathayibacter rathayi]PPG76574.1 hypothetical protein C5C23_07550 [Rathayibacter rathayi]PPH22262.1 hypothetical protein C5C31_09305 [Rathayibacter rathayi]PPH36986.1 hypothetical protein C5C28_04770 [Rathayibacter rathayi]PPH64276.1 hypothetical protein C5C45_12815 [Rathayibacter rathayi]